MDPVNEAQFLQMLIETEGSEGSSQYFFVSPKVSTSTTSTSYSCSYSCYEPTTATYCTSSPHFLFFAFVLKKLWFALSIVSSVTDAPRRMRLYVVVDASFGYPTTALTPSLPPTDPAGHRIRESKRDDGDKFQPQHPARRKQH